MKILWAFVSILIWIVMFSIVCWLLSLEPSWRLCALIGAMGIVDTVLKPSTWLAE